ncbi:MAG TPA: GNAT family N-acetyltransferase [Thermoanaerobaculia bacterium]|nr:GNAT family N-acetyltransferase [Thermoanaerobaculia bacterium]
MGDTLTLRPATAREANLLAALGARTFCEAFAADNRPEDMEAYLASAFTPSRLESELADPQTRFFLAEIEGEAVGYAKLHFGKAPECVTGPDPMEVARFYVVHEWHGRGVAGSLMRACIDAAREAGARTLWLAVWEHNGRAQAFYRKWGFRDVGTQPFLLGGDLQTDRVMERSISPGSTA